MLLDSSGSRSWRILLHLPKKQPPACDPSARHSKPACTASAQVVGDLPRVVVHHLMERLHLCTRIHKLTRRKCSPNRALLDEGPFNDIVSLIAMPCFLEAPLVQDVRRILEH